jgi:hypothetical protein
MSEERCKPTYIMVPRKLLVTWLVVTGLLFTGILASFQYTNYVDRRSNNDLCGLVNAFDDTYKATPPPSDTGKVLAREMIRLRDRFKCS